MINPDKVKYIDSDKITAEMFAKNIAKVFMDLQSSHCFFIFQMAFGIEQDWCNVEQVCKRIIKEVKDE